MPGYSPQGKRCPEVRFARLLAAMTRRHHRKSPVSRPVERTRFLWTPVWGNESGRSERMGDVAAEERPGGGGGGDGGGGADRRGATRAVECAVEDGDRAAAAQGRGAGDSVAGDPGAGARARAAALLAPP